MNQNTEKQTKEEKKLKLLSPKTDIIFQALFGEVGSEEITKGFLKAILGKDINEVDLSQNLILRREYKGDKMGILDILAKIDQEEYCNIEMQLVNHKQLMERLLYYWARIYTKNLNAGNNYSKLKKTIEVLIVDFDIKDLKNVGCHSKWKIIEEKERKCILTDALEIHINLLTKVNTFYKKNYYFFINLGMTNNSLKESFFLNFQIFKLSFCRVNFFYSCIIDA